MIVWFSLFYFISVEILSSKPYLSNLAYVNNSNYSKLLFLLFITTDALRTKKRRNEENKRLNDKQGSSILVHGCFTCEIREFSVINLLERERDREADRDGSRFDNRERQDSGNLC